jgi:hypothetical protein
MGPPSFKLRLSVVLQPMDLGTVLKRLQKGKYQDPAQLKADVQLVSASGGVGRAPAPAGMHTVMRFRSR